MITFKCDTRQVTAKLTKQERELRHKLELQMDKAADAGRDAVKALIPMVFKNPTPYTRNSVKAIHTRGHNMRAAVELKEPDRMGRHYLWAQVEGGQRRKKGFERALGSMYYPASGARLDKYGNMPYGQIVQLLSVLGKAEYTSGYTANINKASKRNRKPRDYVLFKQRHGKLPPGIYQRYQTGPGFGHKTKKTLPFGEWQKGQTRGKFSSAVRARGLKPIMLAQRPPTYRKRLPFYETAGKAIKDAMYGIDFTLVR